MPLGATKQAPGAIRTAASRDDTPAPLQTPQAGSQRKADMATARTTEPLDPAFTTRIPGIPDPEPTITRIVSEELHALALRREAHRRAEEHAKEQR